MALPKPKEDEEKTEFITRCMTDETAKREFPKKAGEKFPKQRYAVCLRRWEENKE